jgi:hypothetical protein
MGTARIVSHVASGRFGPNSAVVEAFLARLTSLTPAEWEQVVEAAPGIGALPDLEVSMAPEYFKAFDAAAKAAKSAVFPGSETAFYDAMRTAQERAGENAFKRPREQPVEAGASLAGERLNPEGEAEAISRLALEGFEEEAWRRAVNAVVVAAGALVTRQWLEPYQFELLHAPVAKIRRG